MKKLSWIRKRRYAEFFKNLPDQRQKYGLTNLSRRSRILAACIFYQPKRENVPAGCGNKIKYINFCQARQEIIRFLNHHLFLPLVVHCFKACTCTRVIVKVTFLFYDHFYFTFFPLYYKLYIIYILTLNLAH